VYQRFAEVAQQLAEPGTAQLTERAAIVQRAIRRRVLCEAALDVGMQLEPFRAQDFLE